MCALLLLQCKVCAPWIYMDGKTYVSKCRSGGLYRLYQSPKERIQKRTEPNWILLMVIIIISSTCLPSLAYPSLVLPPTPPAADVADWLLAAHGVWCQTQFAGYRASSSSYSPSPLPGGVWSNHHPPLFHHCISSAVLNGEFKYLHPEVRRSRWRRRCTV